MSKGLEALERIGNMPTQNNMGIAMINTLRDYDIIKKELKRLEELDNGAYVSVHINRYNELCDKEEALEIIKKHFWLQNFQDFVAIDGRLLKSQKEYDLLKEVLL